MVNNNKTMTIIIKMKKTKKSHNPELFSEDKLQIMEISFFENFKLKRSLRKEEEV